MRVLFTDKARTLVLTTKKFYYGQLSEHDISLGDAIASLGSLDYRRLVCVYIHWISES
ncbi:hypothetical protein [Scytonema sp. PCC 10023]|uniref:hypothetical protein n=1 Tax=Scytonema sp. PCC 10023 TaxID=1680591 RepID=UPI0039C636E7